MHTYRKLIQLLLAGALLIGVTGPASITFAANLHPFLAQMAAVSPGQTVAVIVQKADTSQAAEQRVAQLGGTVTKDLGLINAFAAEMTARDAAQLASSSGVRWISLDAPMASTACLECVDTTNLANVYAEAIRADKVWNTAPYRQGQGVGVAVVDSGIDPHFDLGTRVVARTVFDGSSTTQYYDGYGHGTHMAGVIGGNGTVSKGKYIGVAPKVNLVSVKVSDAEGHITASGVVQGLQWVLAHKDAYNIRVVSMSLNSEVSESYNTSPLDAAVEILWFNKIVVVVSAGNTGKGALYPPANDPFVITVGAANDQGTVSIADDAVASFSAYGTTSDGFAKPDLMAPGANIVSLLSITGYLASKSYPDHVYDGHFRISGTSTSAPMVAGAAALLLQDEPGLTPDQVKYRLKATANKNWSNYRAKKAGAGYLDVYAAVNGATTESANSGVAASHLLWTGSEPVTWQSANWNAVNWNAVNWNAVNWNAVNWNAVNWNSDDWGP